MGKNERNKQAACAPAKRPDVEKLEVLLNGIHKILSNDMREVLESTSTTIHSQKKTEGMIALLDAHLEAIVESIQKSTALGAAISDHMPVLSAISKTYTSSNARKAFIDKATPKTLYTPFTGKMVKKKSKTPALQLILSLNKCLAQITNYRKKGPNNTDVKEWGESHWPLDLKLSETIVMKSDATGTLQPSLVEATIRSIQPTLKFLGSCEDKITGKTPMAVKLQSILNAVKSKKVTSRERLSEIEKKEMDELERTESAKSEKRNDSMAGLTKLFGPAPLKKRKCDETKPLESTAPEPPVKSTQAKPTSDESLFTPEPKESDDEQESDRPSTEEVVEQEEGAYKPGAADSDNEQQDQPPLLKAMEDIVETVRQRAMEDIVESEEEERLR